MKLSRHPVRTARGARESAAGLALAALAMALGLASCDFLKTTPFPGYIDRTDISTDLSDRIEAIAGGEFPIKYDLQAITGSLGGQDTRLLLLVEPPSTDDSGAFDYKGKLIILDEDLDVQGQGGVASSIDYFSKPYSYTHDGTNILAGYTVLTQEGESTTGKIGTPHGLEGFAFADFASTFLFANPSGEYVSFSLSYRNYTGVPIWGIGATGTKRIIPDSARPASTEPNYDMLGYQLIGLYYRGGSAEVTFVLSEPSAKRIVAIRKGFSVWTNMDTPLIDFPGTWPVPASAWQVSIEADRPKVAVCENGLFLVRRDGWMEFYPWTETGDLALTGEPVRIAGDRALDRPYAFLNEGPGESEYMYRFDPASKILTRYTEWWR